MLHHLCQHQTAISRCRGQRRTVTSKKVFTPLACVPFVQSLPAVKSRILGGHCRTPLRDTVNCGGKDRAAPSLPTPDGHLEVQAKMPLRRLPLCWLSSGFHSVKSRILRGPCPLEGYRQRRREGACCTISANTRRPSRGSEAGGGPLQAKRPLHRLLLCCLSSRLPLSNHGLSEDTEGRP